VIPDAWEPLRALTPARIALGRAGTSTPTGARLRFQLDHARARDAVHAHLDEPALLAALAIASGAAPWQLASAAGDRQEYLVRPDLGRRLGDASRAEIAAAAAAAPDRPDLVVVVADGLSPAGVADHAPVVVGALVAPLVDAGWHLAPPAYVAGGRVAVGDEVGALLGARLVLVLIGERPGLTVHDGLGAYLTWDPRPGRTDAERSCVSNIGRRGLDPATSGALLAELVVRARALGGTGAVLSGAAPQAGLGSPP
jgi:ethanolamine ammonia-lyase small subunit